MSFSSALARIFQRPLYTSEVTAFIDGLKTQDASLEARQSAGRAIQWARKADRDTQADMNAGRVAQAAYPYQSHGE